MWMKNSKKYATIQIQQRIKEELSSYCKKNGYKISGLIEKLFVNHLSGSISIGEDK